MIGTDLEISNCCDYSTFFHLKFSLHFEPNSFELKIEEFDIVLCLICYEVCILKFRVQVLRYAALLSRMPGQAGSGYK